MPAACLFLCACTTLPDVPVNVCGNHVLEAGEDCDRAGEGCGDPSGPVACRYICSAEHACDVAGDRCGLDGVCRRATGNYTLTAPVGLPGENFDLVDLDHDGYPDVAARGLSLVTFYDNVRGALTRTSSGPVNADTSINHPISVGSFGSSDGSPLLSVGTSTTVDLYSIGAIVAPLVVPTSFLPAAASADQFLGVVRFSDGGTSAALFYDPARAVLSAFDGDTAVATEIATLDLSPCGAVAGSAVAPALSQPKKGSDLVLVVDGATACLVTADEQVKPALTATVLDVTPLSAFDAAYILGHPVLADVNGDHQLDVVAILRHGTGDAMEDRFVTWMRDPTTGKPGSPTVGMVYSLYPDSEDFQAGDFDGDGYDDLADVDALLINAHTPGEFTFDLWNVAFVNIDYFGEWAIGDVNEDGASDFELSALQNGTVASCLGNGASPLPAFSCFYADTGLPGVRSLVLADLDGDRNIDVAVLGERPATASIPDGGAPPDGGSGVSTAPAGVNAIRMLYGQRGTVPVLNPTRLDPWGSDLLSLARMPPPAGYTYYAPELADRLLAVTRTQGRQGLAYGHSEAGTLPAFGTQTPPFDVRFTDATPAHLQVLTCAYDLDAGVYTQCQVIDYDGNQVGTAIADGQARSFQRSLTADRDAYSADVRLFQLPDDPNPAVVWSDVNDFVIGRYDATSKSYKMNGLTSPDTDVGNTVFFGLADVDGATDPLGDNRRELVLQTLDNGTCNVLVGHFPAGGADPTSLVSVATVDNCVSTDSLYDSDLNNQGVPFFVPSPVVDGNAHPLDLFVTISDPHGRTHLASFAAHGDGTFDKEPQVDPPRFIDGNVAGATVGPLKEAANYRWMATVDMNGDGIPDLVFRTAIGLVVAQAEVIRK